MVRDVPDDGIDILFIFKERSTFIQAFYEDACSVFVNRISTIESGEHPYDGSDYGRLAEDEPPYLVEWTDAQESIEVLGLGCVSMLSASLHAYFLAWEAEVGVAWAPGERSRLLKREGVKGYVREVRKLTGSHGGVADWAFALVLEYISMGTGTGGSLRCIGPRRS